MFFEACQRAVVVLAAFWCAFLVFAIALAVLPLESLQADPALRSLISASMMGVRANMLSAGRLAGHEYLQRACQIVVESANLSFCTYLREMGIFATLLHFTGGSLFQALPRWMRRTDTGRDSPRRSRLDSYASEGESEADSLPALEDCAPKPPPPLGPAAGQAQDWYVFDPVYGVIPQETRDLWEVQEQEREVLLQRARRERLGGEGSRQPVRFLEQRAQQEQQQEQQQQQKAEGASSDLASSSSHSGNGDSGNSNSNTASKKKKKNR
ncbi:hypothetical protein B484DRAFT_446524 [Ochromonadaceae sp. CCMP2298]|nr:hypothetical protein B484DRAFT_446524 [Ochromonadaceae sp. CCMP2298]|mmetsp:Transcript_27864/g.60044  ORF Transcript_27864/g.60044 Transcript_27864/m.60044 type:complete len:268 (-) Transcript_27864:71-874(-)